jgi:hypothetical protein
MKSIMTLILTMILAPFLKSFIEYFTTPETGILVTLGVDEGTIAFINLIPWLFPLGAIILVIIAIAKGGNDDENRISRNDEDFE